MVCCVHNIPGRARFKLEALRRDAELARMIKDALGRLDGISSVEINRDAASIIVHYQADRGDIEKIMDHICVHCPNGALTGRMPAHIPAAVAHRVEARSRSRFADAMRDAASKAVVNTLIKRTLESGLSGAAVRLR